MNKSPWEYVPLGAVAQVSAGDPAPQGNDSFAPDGVPFVRMQDLGRHGKTTCLTDIKDRVTAKVSARLKKFPAGSILLPKSGASIRLNHRAILGFEAHVVSHLAIIETGPRLSNRFAYYWLCTRDLSTVAHDAHLPSMKTSSLAGLSIPVPTIAEQERIVKLLDAAEELRRLRAEADRRTADLIPAIFYEMFGDSETNAERWIRKPLSKVVRIIVPSRDKPKRFDGDIPWVTLPDISGLFVYNARNLLTQEDAAEVRNQLMPANTVLLSCAGSLCKVAVATTEIYANQQFYGLVPTPDILDSVFLAVSLMTKGESFFHQLAGTSTLAFFSKRRALEIEISLPPLNLQRQFAARVAEVRALEAQQAASRQRLDDLFQSMLHRAFCGEL